MVDRAIKEQILDDLEQLTPEEQRRIAESVRSMRERPEDHRGGLTLKEILPDLGVLDPESAREMREAIEEEFEKIDPGEW